MYNDRVVTDGIACPRIRGVKNKDPVFERIEAVIKQTGLSQAGLCIYVGIKSNVYTEWKYEGGRSYLRYIDKIAEYLHVSSEYLLNPTGQAKPGGIADGREKLFIELFRDLDFEKQNHVFEILRNMNKLQQFEKEQK